MKPLVASFCKFFNDKTLLSYFNDSIQFYLYTIYIHSNIRRLLLRLLDEAFPRLGRNEVATLSISRVSTA